MLDCLLDPNPETVFSCDYEGFQERYWLRPDLFVQECFQWRKGEGPTAYQLDILRNLVRKKRVCVRGPHGLGKCVGYTEPMRLANGELIEAQSLIGKEFEVLAVDESLKVHVAKAYAWDNGIKDVVKITTDKGRVLTRTCNHPLWADNSPVRYSKPEYSKRMRPQGAWIAAGDLAIGATVAVYLGNETKTPYPLSDEAIKITAYLLGDGGLTSGSVMISQAAGAQLEEIKECADAFDCSLKQQSQFDFRISKKSGSYGKRTNKLQKMLVDCGMMGTNSFTKKFPDWVWLLDDRQLGLFLSRLFACDGWAHFSLRKDGKRNKEIGLTSVSEEMARQVSCALLRLGIQSEVRQKKTSWTHKGEKKFGTAFSVAMHDAENILLFCERVGIFGKENKVNQLADECRNSSQKEQQKWRHTNLPSHMAWEKIARIELIASQPTVAISVPQYETFLTEFVEHNTSMNAWLILWFALTRDGRDWKMATTAGAWRQLTKFLWPEVHKWARRLDWAKVGRAPFDPRHELQTMSLKLSTGEAFAVASNLPELIEGAHADHLFYIYDESKAIGDDTFDAAEGAFSGAVAGNEAFAVATSTPGEPIGRFYDIQTRKPGFEDWWARAVTLDEVVEAGRVSVDWALQRSRQWGQASALYIRRVLGDFASDDESGVIPLAWIEAAQARWVEWEESGKPGELEALGIDVGGGGDASVLAKLFRVTGEGRVKNAIDTLYYGRSKDSLAIGSVASRTLNSRPDLRTVIDSIGIGSGTLFDLRRSFSRILGFVAGGAARAPSGRDKTDRSGEILFADNRSWAWWTMREMLDPQYDEGWALPPDDRLTGDLSAPKWAEQGKGRIKVESKKEIGKRLGRSTDAADAVIHTLYDEPEPERSVIPPSRAGWA